MKKRMLTIFVIIICATITINACSKACPEIGEKAPDFTLQTLNDDSVSLSDFLGRPVIINFWSTQCGPCVREMPLFQSIYDNWSSQGLIILAINVNDNATVASKFATAQELTFVIMLDANKQVFDRYCLPQAIPITLFVSPVGTLEWRKVGSFGSQEEIENILQSL